MTVHLEWTFYRILARVLGALFFPAHEIDLTDGQLSGCESIFRRMVGGVDSEICTLPRNLTKVEFLHYLVNNKRVLLHGSNRGDIRTLHPEFQVDFQGNRTRAVFSSADPIWPIFFAILDRSVYQGSIRNGCFVLAHPSGGNERYYFFSTIQGLAQDKLWREGVIYILPGDNFSQTSSGRVRFDEWASSVSVDPVGKISISPRDFPFLNQVSMHKDSEPMYVTWLLYKSRLKHRSSKM
ncbi:MAG: hypothetical protein JSV42_17750 [Chloroflexota bacterium]|nr:MAG: hypothetical protein JSV42_17750 [Chloroflexota bacterium]